MQYSDGSKFYPDYFTNLVGLQIQALLEAFGYRTELVPHPDEPSLKIILNGNYLARVVEGCNSISVIVLFASFVIAFSGQLKTTFFYLLFGSVLIYIANLFRIVILSIGLYHYPKYQHALHSVVFPGIIYGMVFLLWVFWVNRFSKMNKVNA